MRLMLHRAVVTALRREVVRNGSNVQVLLAGIERPERVTHSCELIVPISILGHDAKPAIPAIATAIASLHVTTNGRAGCRGQLGFLHVRSLVGGQTQPIACVHTGWVGLLFCQ